jgi:hypothetical protein
MVRWMAAYISGPNGGTAFVNIHVPMAEIAY